MNGSQDKAEAGGADLWDEMTAEAHAAFTLATTARDVTLTTARERELVDTAIAAGVVGALEVTRRESPVTNAAAVRHDARVSFTEFLLDRLAEREQAIRELTVWPEHLVMQELAFSSAVRFLVSEHRPMMTEDDVDDLPAQRVALCAVCDEEWPCRSLRAVATVFAWHREFDPSWALSASA